MKQKVLIISLFLVVCLVLSSLLALTSLSLSKQIKSTFSDDNNELFEDFIKLPTEEKKVQEDKKSNKLVEWLTKPPTGKLKFVEEKKGSDEILPVLNFREKILPSEDTTQRTNFKVAVFYSLLVILLFITIYFLRKRYKKKNNGSSNNQYEVEGVPKKLAVLENKDGNEITPFFSKEKSVEASIPKHEIRKLLQEWEARLVGKNIKKEAETINEWFERIKGPIEIIPIYEKVRYGEKICTEEEIKFIKNSLKLRL